MGGPCLYVAEYPAVVRCPQQALVLAEPLGGVVAVCVTAHPVSNPLSAEEFAAFGAATVDNLAAVLGGHAGAETVGALAFENAGLKCSFHDCESN